MDRRRLVPLWNHDALGTSLTRGMILDMIESRNRRMSCPFGVAVVLQVTYISYRLGGKEE
jgi:hypothetical protein